MRTQRDPKRRETSQTNFAMSANGLSGLLNLVVDAVHDLGLCMRPSPTLVAENLFLRKQLALYQERHIQHRPISDATRIVMIWLSLWFDWRSAWRIIKPETVIRWHQSTRLSGIWDYA